MSSSAKNTILFYPFKIYSHSMYDKIWPNALSYICHQWNYGLFAYILRHINLFYNRSIPSQSVWVKQKLLLFLFFFFFHVASEHVAFFMLCFRKTPANSCLIVTVKHSHKVSLGSGIKPFLKSRSRFLVTIIFS